MWINISRVTESMPILRPCFTIEDTQNNDAADLQYMSFCVPFIHSTIFIIFCIILEIMKTVMFDWISYMIENITSKNPSASVHICGDSNIHHKDCFVQSNQTDKDEGYCRDFIVAYGITNIKESMPISDTKGHLFNLLDLFLTSLPSLINSDLSLIRVKHDTKPKHPWYAIP